jgi:hypothetical protein
MEISEAIKIIKTVADGINPFTGEVFSGDSVYQQPQMVRALYRAVGALEVRERYERKKRQLPENAGKQWTEEDDNQLISGFDSGEKIRDLARKFKRTYGSIEARLEILGKIEPK